MILWLQFIVGTGVILYAGTKLTVYGDIIAEKTGLGRTWIGAVDLAFGNILGSNLFNIISA